MTLVLAQNGAGDYAIGATIDGVFVPFASVEARRVRNLADRAKVLEERAGDPSHEGHAPAANELEQDWKPVTGKTTKGDAS